jgi:hypothetical protein
MDNRDRGSTNGEVAEGGEYRHIEVTEGSGCAGNCQSHGEDALPQPCGDQSPTVVIGRRCPNALSVAFPEEARQRQPSSLTWWPTPSAKRRLSRRVRKGKWGTALSPAWLPHAPSASSSNKPLPGPSPPYVIG